MTLRDILICTDAATAGDVRFELARNLAQASKAHLTTVYALQEPAARLPVSGNRHCSDRSRASLAGGCQGHRGTADKRGRAGAQVLCAAEGADTVEERFREELQLRGLDGEWLIHGAPDWPRAFRPTRRAPVYRRARRCRQARRREPAFR